MTARHTRRRERLVRYDSLDDMPPPQPLSKTFREMSDREAARRAKADPDAGVIPRGFWEKAPCPHAAERSSRLRCASTLSDPLVQAHRPGLPVAYGRGAQELCRGEEEAGVKGWRAANLVFAQAGTHWRSMLCPGRAR